MKLNFKSIFFESLIKLFFNFWVITTSVLEHIIKRNDIFHPFRDYSDFFSIYLLCNMINERNSRIDQFQQDPCEKLNTSYYIFHSRVFNSSCSKILSVFNYRRLHIDFQNLKHFEACSKSLFFQKVFTFEGWDQEVKKTSSLWKLTAFIVFLWWNWILFKKFSWTMGKTGTTCDERFDHFRWKSRSEDKIC
jgi:hypothetical protein